MLKNLWCKWFHREHWIELDELKEPQWCIEYGCIECGAIHYEV